MRTKTTGGTLTMAELELFEKLTLRHIGRWLDVHPFDIVRVIAVEGGLPPQLAFDEYDVDRIRERTGVETWWDGGALPVSDENRRRALVRSLIHKLLENADGRLTRADNLTRGLEGDDQATVRRAVNQLIRDGQLLSQSTSRGLEVCVSPDHRAILQSISEGRDIPKQLEALWA